MIDAKPSASARPAVPEEDLREAFKGPAAHSNKIIATTTFAGIRLAFLEGTGSVAPPQFRTAVLLSFQDAVQLRDLLDRQLTETTIAVEMMVGPDGKPRPKDT